MPVIQWSFTDCLDMKSFVPACTNWLFNQRWWEFNEACYFANRKAAGYGTMKIHQSDNGVTITNHDALALLEEVAPRPSIWKRRSWLYQQSYRLSLGLTLMTDTEADSLGHLPLGELEKLGEWHLLDDAVIYLALRAWENWETGPLVIPVRGAKWLHFTTVALKEQPGEQDLCRPSCGMIAKVKGDRQPGCSRWAEWKKRSVFHCRGSMMRSSKTCLWQLML